MVSSQGTSSTVTIELPEGFPRRIAGTPEEFAREFRLAAAIEWYREGRISQGKAAEIAGLGRWEFIEALGRAKVNVIHEEVLLDDVEQAVRAHRDLIRERAEDAAGVFDRDAAEIHYRALGRWKGKLAAADVQAASRDFWHAAGEAGGYWLARRLRWESNVETLLAVASLLARLGPVALAPIVEELGENPASDQARALLQPWAGWVNRPRPRSYGGVDRADPGPVPPESRPRHPRVRRPSPAIAPARGPPTGSASGSRGARSRRRRDDPGRAGQSPNRRGLSRCSC